MHFAQPLWIAAGLFCCIMVYLLHLHMEKRRFRVLQTFAAKTLLANLTGNVSGTKRKIKVFLLIGGLFFCFAALARPQYGHRWIDVKRKGIDILFAIDTSASMLAEDITPNRLERSKFAILDFIKQLDGDRVGLMPFAGSAYLMCPLTVDYQAFEQSLQAVDTTIIPQPGTNLANTILHAESVLENDANHKILIIITDGENLQGDTQAAAGKAAEKGMRVFTVGVGTPEGELIPLKNSDSPGFVKDASGQFVVSRLDEKSLRDIAETTDGLYVPLGQRGQGLETIYERKLILIPKEELAEKRHKVPVDRFPWFLGIALALFVFEYLIPSRKTKGPAFAFPKGLRRKVGMLVCLAAGSLYQPSSAAMASPGEEAFHDNDFLGAAQYYEEALAKDPDNAALHYNHGTAAYKNNLYDDAIVSFGKALQSDDLLLQEKAYYNRANAQFKKGEESLQADPGKTIAGWKEALTSYQAALELRPDNREAAANLELVRKKLEELEQQEHNRKNEEQKGEEGDGDETKQDGDEKQADSKPLEDREQQRDNSGMKNDEKQTDRNAPDKQEANRPKDGPEEEKQHPREAEPQPDAGPDNGEHLQAKVGQMSKEEAEQLLKEMKNEEGALNFIPKTDTAPQEDTQGSNW